MLVLSRRCQDSICFPELDISIEILQVKGSTVRVGVDAPLEINVLRGELHKDGDRTVGKKIIVSAKDEHAVRNKLNQLSIASGLAKKLLSIGKTALAASTLHDAIASMEEEPVVNSKAEPSVRKALLVEDADNEREMLAGFLRLHGYHVDTSRDGVEAMEYLEDNEKPNFILMDMQLPRLNGASTIRKIRDNIAFDDVKIYAVSGQTPILAGIDLKENRVAQWFQKPLRPANLIAAIHDDFVLRDAALLQN